MSIGLRIRLIFVVLLGVAALQGALAPFRFDGWRPALQHPHLTAHVGLDLQGGTRILLQARGTASVAVTPENVDAVMRVIAARVDQIGVTEPVIQRLGERRIAVELPGIQDPQRAIALIGKTALLEFVATGATRLPVGARWSADGTAVTLPSPGGALSLRKAVVLTGAGLADAHAVFDPSSTQPVVQFRFGGQAARTLDAFTGAHVGEYLTIVLDNEVISSPIIRSRLTGGSGQISGGFRGLAEAHDLAVLLRGGALPLPVDVVESRTVGPLLGQDAIQTSLRAGAVAALAVALFMALYPRERGAYPAAVRPAGEPQHLRVARAVGEHRSDDDPGHRGDLRFRRRRDPRPGAGADGGRAHRGILVGSQCLPGAGGLVVAPAAGGGACGGGP